MNGGQKELVLSFCPLGLGSLNSGPPRVLGGKHLYTLSHLTDSQIILDALKLTIN